MVHSHLASTALDSLYYSLNQHRLTEEKQLFEETKKESSHEVTPGMQRRSAVTSFGGGAQSIDTEIGAIIEVYHLESSTRLGLAEEEVLNLINTIDNRVYYKLTSDGYNQLYFYRVIPTSVPINISKDIEDEALDKRIGEWIDLTNAPNIEIVGFVQYPDTSGHGNTIDSGDRKTIMADGLSSTMITHGVSMNEKRLMDINLNNLELFLPHLSGMSGEHFEGEMLWTIDMVP